jgi:hypothetical protein
LLSIGFTGRDEIRKQLDACSVREIDENGSLEFLIPSARALAHVTSRVPSEGEYSDSDGVTVHVLLHVVNGVVNELELFKEDNSVVKDRDGVAAIEVFSG